MQRNLFFRLFFFKFPWLPTLFPTPIPAHHLLPKQVSVRLCFCRPSPAWLGFHQVNREIQLQVLLQASIPQARWLLPAPSPQLGTELMDQTLLPGSRSAPRCRWASGRLLPSARVRQRLAWLTLRWETVSKIQLTPPAPRLPVCLSCWVWFLVL